MKRERINVFKRKDNATVEVYTVDAPNPRKAFANVGELAILPRLFREYGVVGDEDIPEVRRTRKFWDSVIAKDGVVLPVYGKVDWKNGKLNPDGSDRLPCPENMSRRLTCEASKAGKEGYQPVGYISATAQVLRRLYEIRRISAKMRENVLHIMQLEVALYDAWLNGEVYEYRVLNGAVEIDRSDGFYGPFESNGLYQHAGLDPNALEDLQSAPPGVMARRPAPPEPTFPVVDAFSNQEAGLETIPSGESAEIDCPLCGERFNMHDGVFAKRYPGDDSSLYVCAKCSGAKYRHCSGCGMYFERESVWDTGDAAAPGVCVGCLAKDGAKLAKGDRVVIGNMVSRTFVGGVSGEVESVMDHGKGMLTVNVRVWDGSVVPCVGYGLLAVPPGE